LIRRILIAGCGGIAGIVLWYFLLSPLLAVRSDRANRLGLYGLVGCVVGCGVLVMVLGEKLRLIPSQEQVDQKMKPVSLFSAANPKGGPGPGPQS